MSCTNEPNEIPKMVQFVPQVNDVFDVKEKVGEGTFSKVYRAVVKESKVGRQEYALKYLVPTSKPSRIACELQCLKEVGGSDNIVGVEFCLMNNGHVVIVMPYYPHQKFSDYVRHLGVDDIRDYMRNLFVALCKIHSCGIVHRDIKPNNFLYSQGQRSYMLVDFGLAQRSSELLPRCPYNRQPLSDSSGRLNKNVQRLYDSPPVLEKMVPCESLPAPVNVYRYQIENVSKKRKLSPPRPPTFNEPSPGLNKQFVPCLPSKPQYHPHSKPKNAPKYAKSNKSKDCGCFEKATVCKICLGREPEEAPRGGTPGFRAPEVLLKYKYQTTAIDMWSAGVILLSILSKKHPFFRADDDLTALAEITFLVGTKEIKAAAISLGKVLTMNLPETTESISDIRKQLGPARYLQALCTMIQQEQSCNVHTYSNEKDGNTNCIFCYETARQIPECAYDLLDKLLDPNPETRIKAADALMHPFITGER